ncbi:MAG: protein phosphatase CheZ [Alphaproteobacteria bacterium]|nr:protein phosphatase CheZ [Alphaproteobacteria bacterium]
MPQPEKTATEGHKDTVYRKDQVASIINSVIGKVQSVPRVPAADLESELVALKSMIDELHAQLGQVNAGDISGQFIPSATDELDAIVEATEKATDGIMESCEAIQSLVSSPGPDLASKVEEQITRVYEACTFQDITGQRITKIVKTLKKIDERVSSLVGMIEGKVNAVAGVEGAAGPTSLLNGPALPQNAISQDDIDKLLAEFDQN